MSSGPGFTVWGGGGGLGFWGSTVWLSEHRANINRPVQVVMGSAKLLLVVCRDNNNNNSNNTNTNNNHNHSSGNGAGFDRDDMNMTSSALGSRGSCRQLP